MHVFSLAKANKYCLYPERCVTGSAPTLYTLANAYNSQFPIQWLMTMIVGLSEYMGCKTKATPYQVEKLAYKIYSDYGFLKSTEVMLFFDRLESGSFGQLDYGSFDPIAILQKMPQFMEYRQDLYAKAESRKVDEQLRKQREEAVPCPPHIKEHLDKFFQRLASKSHRPDTQQAVHGLQQAFSQQNNPLTITNEEKEQEEERLDLQR